MGNIWTGVDEDALIQTESRLLGHTGLGLDSFDRRYIPINDGESLIRTITVGEVSNIRI